MGSAGASTARGGRCSRLLSSGGQRRRRGLASSLWRVSWACMAEAATPSTGRRNLVAFISNGGRSSLGCSHVDGAASLFARPAAVVESRHPRIRSSPMEIHLRRLVHGVSGRNCGSSRSALVNSWRPSPTATCVGTMASSVASRGVNRRLNLDPTTGLQCPGRYT